MNERVYKDIIERVWQRFFEAVHSADQEYQETKAKATTHRDDGLAEIEAYYQAAVKAREQNEEGK